MITFLILLPVFAFLAIALYLDKQAFKAPETRWVSLFNWSKH